MKLRPIIISLCFLFVTTIAISQNPLFDHGISFKGLFMDYQSQNGGNISDFQNYHRGFEIGFHKKLQSNFNLVVPFKIGVVSGRLNEVESYHKTIYGVDAQLQYLFYKDNAVVTPYVMLGAGGVYEDEGETNIQIPVGAGLIFKVAENTFVNWQSEYRYSLADDRNNLHHGIGFVYLFGGDGSYEMPEKEMKDSDGDGLEDEVDLCPQSPGPKELNGCPDTDGDGIADYQDECPNFVGLKAFNGCPDTDGDGISDNDDECPSIAGTIDNNGCPEEKDTDGDGVLDKDDNCPNIAGDADFDGCPKPVTDADGDGVSDALDDCPNEKGTLATNGCPDRDGDGIVDKNDKCPSNFGLKAYGGCPDTDGDGIDDSRDRCPTMFGAIDNNGCPEIKKEDKQVLDLAMRAVQFETGKATLKSESYSILNQVSELLARYPDYNLNIEGHTDNVGKASNNQLLSEKRAKSTYDYLIKKGIKSERLSYVGFGEVAPISDNNTLKGRALNRRVEFNLVPR